MDFLNFGLTQTMTLWVRTGVDEFNEPSFAAPVQRSCRWEQRTEKLLNAEGEIVLGRARIFLDADVALGDYVAFGVVAGSDPREIPNAYQVLEFRSTPSLDGLAYERKAYV